MSIAVKHGDCRAVLPTLPDASVHCVVTSPPYWGLRDYGTATWEGGDPVCDHKQGRNGSGRADGVVDERGQRNRDGVGSMGGNCQKCGAVRIDAQLGLEPDFNAYVASMVAVFREVRRVLRDDGTLWLNLGDSYSNAGTRQGDRDGDVSNGGVNDHRKFYRPNAPGLKSKDLCGIPWRVAFALQADGWYLRQDIIWSKPNPMPESVTDRCTKAHEYLFLLSKRERYYYDADAIREPQSDAFLQRAERTWNPSSRNGSAKPPADSARWRVEELKPHEAGRNKRSVWEVTTQPFAEAHFATFPPALIEPCIRAGCPVGGTVLDPFAGAGTTGLVADRLGRNAILIELNPTYADMATNRIRDDAGLFAEITP